MRFTKTAGRAASSAVLFLLLFCPGVVDADTRFVRRGENLQLALNAAASGDVIVLEAGAEFLGNFVLPVKSGDFPIIVRSAASALLPGPGVRIQASHVPLLARIRSPNNASALKTAAGAHHWELRYLEFGGNHGGYGDIIQLGDGSSAQNTLAKVPHHLVLSHLYVHGDRLVGQKRCIGLNAASVTIRDSTIFDCKGVGIDAQAIGGWNGPGPYLIENNYLEGSGENVLFGGADPSIDGLVPTDITFRRNMVSRPMAWRHPIIPAAAGVTASAEGGGSLPAGSYSYRIVARRSVGQGTIGRSTASEAVTATVGDAGAVRVSWRPVPDATEYRVYGRTAGAEGVYWTVPNASFLDHGAAGTAGAVPTGPGTVWSVKNLFELKNARRVVVEENVFENHWKESQQGYSLVLTPRNSNGGCTWCVVDQVRFESNVIRHVSAGINLLGYDMASRPTKQTTGVHIRNNLFYDMSTAYGGDAWFLLIGDGPRDVIVNHNTVAHDGSSFVFAYGGSSGDPREMSGVYIINNAVRHGTYGITGEFFSYGNGVINAFFPDGAVTSNFLAGGSASRYPAGNLFAGTFDAQFMDAPAGDFRLKADSPLRHAGTDGGDIGVDIARVLAATSTVAVGVQEVVATPLNLRVLAR